MPKEIFYAFFFILHSDASILIFDGFKTKNATIYSILFLEKIRYNSKRKI